MNKKNDSYSDLESARRLSRQLSALPEMQVEMELNEIEYDYVSFEKIRINNIDLDGIQDIPEDKPTIETLEDDIEPEVYPFSLSEDLQDRSQFWSELVKWACDVTSADTVFLCQSGGMLVALNGAVMDIEPEAIGGRLLNMLDQAEKLSNENKGISSIMLKLDKYWVTGITLFTNEESLLIVFVTAKLLKENIITAVKKELSEFLKN